MENIAITQNIKIIPLPVQIEVENGVFELSKMVSLIYEDVFEAQAIYLRDLLSSATGSSFEMKKLKKGDDQWDSPSPTDKSIILIKSFDNDDLNKIEEKNKREILHRLPNEGYFLGIQENRIAIKTTPNNNAGVFYAIQSLRQLFPPEIEMPTRKGVIKGVRWTIPKCEIIDYPRFKWRGFMMDETRHFFGMRFIKRMLDLMALHKLNILHWHINDDEGWRIEIEKYPKLTQIAGKRLLNKKFKETSNMEDYRWYGGYYTKDQIKEIIKYASERFIKIVPEIEMPGHATAPLVAYPQFSCDSGTPPELVPSIGGRNRHAYCAGNPPTYEFLKDILDEVSELFNFNIHIGGDELPKERWTNCSRCQKFMKENGIADIDELQVHFAAEFIKYLQDKGRTVIGWFDFPVDRLLDKDVDPEKLVFQFWKGSEKDLKKFVRKGGISIVSYHPYYYLDYTYYRTPLKKTYNYEPIPEDLEEDLRKRVLGIESPLWTERVPDWQMADFRTFPRLTAVAESAWTPRDKKDYKNFIIRLKTFLKRLDILGVYYAPLSVAMNKLRARVIPVRRLL
ncbi:MAG: beta-N-acetylhexosaminidase [Promethearchaeota archaeon]